MFPVCFVCPMFNPSLCFEKWTCLKINVDVCPMFPVCFVCPMFPVCFVCFSTCFLFVLFVPSFPVCFCLSHVFLYVLFVPC